MNSAVLETPSLVLEFNRCGDRFRHEVRFRDRRTSSAALGSLEGSPDDLWPPSPPLQSMHVDTDARGQKQVMLVGMAGASHWSLGVVVDLDNDRFHFDVACRVRDRPRDLGSRYLSTSADPQAEINLIVVPVPPLECEYYSGSTVVLAPRLSIQPPATIRWQYSIAANRQA